MNVLVGNNYSVSNANTAKPIAENPVAQTANTQDTQARTAQQSTKNGALLTDVVEISAEAIEASIAQANTNVESDLNLFKSVVFANNNGFATSHQDIHDFYVRNGLRNEDGSWTERGLRQLRDTNAAMNSGRNHGEVLAVWNSFITDDGVGNNSVTDLSDPLLQQLSERLGMTEEQQKEMISLIRTMFKDSVSDMFEVSSDELKVISNNILQAMQQLHAQFDESE